uniref:Uncharacterized protein n=1 Tax=Arundo donax TaxID=35708 RepID=A0A0A8ZB90_ARUDO
MHSPLNNAHILSIFIVRTKH